MLSSKIVTSLAVGGKEERLWILLSWHTPNCSNWLDLHEHQTGLKQEKSIVTARRLKRRAAWVDVDTGHASFWGIWGQLSQGFSIPHGTHKNPPQVWPNVILFSQTSFSGKKQGSGKKKAAFLSFFWSLLFLLGQTWTIKTSRAYFPLQTLPLHAENVMFITWFYPVTQTANCQLQSDLITIPCSYSSSRFLHADHVLPGSRSCREQQYSLKRIPTPPRFLEPVCLVSAVCFAAHTWNWSKFINCWLTKTGTPTRLNVLSSSVIW